jgi:hypothetical protein
MLKRLSVVILSAATLAACSESLSPTDSSPAAPTGRALLAQLTCNADVAAKRISCAPAAPSLARGSADLIIGGQNTYTTLASTNVITTGTTSLTGDVTVQNLTGQPWATADGTTPTANGVRVFFYTMPNNGVTIANADGTGTFTASNQPYFQYTGSALGADGILSSSEVSSSKNWQFNLNGASSFTFQVYVTTQLPDEGGVLLWTPSAVAQSGPVEHLNAIWGASASDIWIAGQTGANVLQHWNGTSWSSFAGAESVDMVALWGSGSSDVYAVGGTKMQHWNGSTWSDTTAAPNTLLAVWGSSATDVYACGKTGTLVHSSGGAFSAVAGNPLGTEDCAAIWGSSSSDVYIGEANVYRYNGTSWSAVSAGITGVRAIWGTSPSDVWIGGTSGNVVHYDGSSWSAPLTVGNADVAAIWGTSTSDVYLVNRAGSIWHFNGSNWVKYRNPADSYVGVWGSSRTDVWVVGADSAFTNNKAYHGTR